jgi:hypothetical protein
MNIKNLKILRDWLAAGNIKQEQFDMERYRNGENSLRYINKDNCGTVGCILGWCPFIPEFSNYKSTSFGFLTEELLDIEHLSNKWNFLFSGEWVDYDNTIEGAIARIDIVIAGDFEG